MQVYLVVFSIGWRRPIGCFNLQVIFRKRATKYRALLQKMTSKEKASYDSTPLCTHDMTCHKNSCCVCVYVYVCVCGVNDVVRTFCVYMSFTTHSFLVKLKES